MGGRGRSQQSHVGISGMANNLFRKFSLSVPFAIKQKRYKSQNSEKKKKTFCCHQQQGLSRLTHSHFEFFKMNCLYRLKMITSHLVNSTV